MVLISLVKICSTKKPSSAWRFASPALPRRVEGPCRARDRGQDSRTAPLRMPTPDQMLVLRELDQRQNARDWRGVAALEREARSLAAAVRAAEPGLAAFVYSALGNAHYSLGDFRAAIACHTEDLAIAREVGDRAGEGERTGTSGMRIRRWGTFARRHVPSIFGLPCM